MDKARRQSGKLLPLKRSILISNESASRLLFRIVSIGAYLVFSETNVISIFYFHRTLVFYNTFSHFFDRFFFSKVG